MGKENKLKTCFYCGALIPFNSGVGDHFPIPKRNGGTSCVNCCESCHSMKDRFTLESWSSEWSAKVISDFPMMSRETRLFLAKAMSLFSDAINAQKESR